MNNLSIMNDRFIYYVMLIISNLDDIERISLYPSKQNYYEKIEVVDNANEKNIIISSNENIIFSITLPSYYFGTKSNYQYVKKILIYLFAQINEHALKRYELLTNEISFSLQDIVNLGIYSNIKTARAGIHKALDFISKIEINLSTNVYIIKSFSIQNSICNIIIDTSLPDIFQTNQFYVTLPSIMFSLSNNAFTLLYYVLYQARVNNKKDKNISMISIQRILGLPLIGGNKNVKTTVINPIKNALSEVEQCEQDVIVIKLIDTSNNNYEFINKSKLSSSLKNKIKVRRRYAYVNK